MRKVKADSIADLVKMAAKLRLALAENLTTRPVVSLVSSLDRVFGGLATCKIDSFCEPIVSDATA
jgi:hypothetical protein